MIKLLKRAVDFALPSIDKCVVCGVEKGVSNLLCAKCSEKLNASKCAETQAKEYKAYSAYDYEGEAKRIVRKFKFGDERYLTTFMAQEMIKGLSEQHSLITFVPLHDKRKKHRGYDQAQLLAKEISSITRIPFARTLKRVKNTKTQTSMSSQERQSNMQGAFESIQKIAGRVVLIDDVLTTGATAAECAGVLKNNGADDVLVLTFARATGEKKKKRKWFSRR